MNHIPSNLNYPIYDLVYGNELPSDQYYVITFGCLPSKHINGLFYDVSLIEYFYSSGFKLVTKIFTTSRKLDKKEQILFINHTKKIILTVNNECHKNKKDNFMTFDILYDITLGEIESQLEFFNIEKYERKKKKSNINLVRSDMGHLDIEDYDLPIPPMDLLLNYGVEFLKVHDVIVNKLNEDRGKGIILLHGDPGTGKTSYIKYLSSLINGKDILFIPPSMAEMLSEPSIIPFLMDHKNSILIIEDAERVIGDRENNGSSAGVSNILNLTDGILGDCLSIQIIATFNMKREKIDKALLRKGRLIAEHKFEKLSIQETNNLLEHLGKTQTVNESMCLADIYNIDVELYKTNNVESKIGFKK
jgi:hypothetical protein